MGDLYGAVGRFWCEHGLDPGGGASEAELSAFGRRYGVRLPAEEPEASPVFIVAAPSHCVRVADSFREFWQGYLRRDAGVLFGAPTKGRPTI